MKELSKNKLSSDFLQKKGREPVARIPRSNWVGISEEFSSILMKIV